MRLRTRLSAGLLAGLLGGLLEGCGPGVQPIPRAESLPDVPAGLCRVGPDGGIPVAERGIGGTGSPIQLAERGIGGTGAPAAGGSRSGIVGIITGFASVCLAGQEVEYGPGLPVEVDGRAAGLEALRAGQVAVVVADGARPVAARLSVRHEVSGPVERVERDGSLRVAGQRVMPMPGLAVAPGVGRWVQVSGLRRADGVVVASRFDVRTPGEVLLRGVMRQENGGLWIGLVEVRPGRFQFRQPGVPVLAIGRLNDGVLEADTVEPDGLLVDPAAYFGPAVRVLVLEGYAEGGFVSFGGRLRSGVGLGLGGVESGGVGSGGVGSGRALARFERGAGGEFAASPMRADRAGEFGGRYGVGAAPRGGFTPAPTPNHAFDLGAGRFGERAGAGDRGGSFRGGRGTDAPGEARPGGEIGGPGGRGPRR